MWELLSARLSCAFLFDYCVINEHILDSLFLVCALT